MEWLVTVEAAADATVLESRLAALQRAFDQAGVGASVDADNGTLGVTLVIESTEVEEALQRGLQAWRAAEAAAGVDRLTLSSAEVVPAGDALPQVPSALEAG